MRKLSLYGVAALLAMTSLVQADHRTWVIEIKGNVEVNGEGGVMKIAVSNDDFLSESGNFLVATVDAIPETIDFTIAEWADTNEDGIPDTPVDLDLITPDTQSEILVRHSMAALQSDKFMATLETIPDRTFFQGSLVVDGKVKLKNENQESFSGKVSGPINDPDLGDPESAIFKGSIKTVGEPLPFE